MGPHFSHMSDPAFATSQDLIAQKKKKKPKNPNTRFPICGDFISPTFQNSNPVFLFLANPFLPYVATPFLPFVRCFFHFFLFFGEPISPICGDPVTPMCQKFNSFFFFRSSTGKESGIGPQLSQRSPAKRTMHSCQQPSTTARNEQK